jgi:hypothetical protein
MNNIIKFLHFVPDVSDEQSVSAEYSIALPAIYGNNHRDVHIVLVLFVILRLMRIFRLLEVCT